MYSKAAAMSFRSSARPGIIASRKSAARLRAALAATVRGLTMHRCVWDSSEQNFIAVEVPAKCKNVTVCDAVAGGSVFSLQKLRELQVTDWLRRDQAARAAYQSQKFPFPKLP
jgi:hypothetical protein